MTPRVCPFFPTTSSEGLRLRLQGTRCGFASCLHGAAGGGDLSSLARAAYRCGNFGLPNLPGQGGSPVLQEESLVPFRSHHSLFYQDQPSGR